MSVTSATIIGLTASRDIYEYSKELVLAHYPNSNYSTVRVDITGVTKPDVVSVAVNTENVVRVKMAVGNEVKVS